MLIPYSGLSKMLEILYSKFWAATATGVRWAPGKRLQGRTERVKQVLSPFALQGDNLTTGTTNVGVNVKCLPQVVNGSGPWHSPYVDEDANIGLEDRTEGVEKPTMRVDFFLVLLLQTEDNLHRDVATFRTLDIERGRVDGNWGTLN